MLRGHAPPNLGGESLTVKPRHLLHLCDYRQSLSPVWSRDAKSRTAPSAELSQVIKTVCGK